MLARTLPGFLLLTLTPLCSASKLATVPAEIASSHYTVTVDGEATPVLHAALNLYFLNFDAHKHTKITVTADSDDFWAAGVEVQPWRLGIRPVRHGRTISFTLDGAAKISISRPGDFFSNSEMLYLFANPPEKKPPTSTTAGVRYFGPGVHRENIDAGEGDHIYLAAGAVVFGALNLWQVNHVSVAGPGVIVYDGPQNPANDDGWMHKRNWHCIVMDNAHDISIEGITCVVRSRTWQIQMKDSRRIVFDNIKVIGANDGNANADGMDWLGGGDTVVRNSFFRAADDVFAMQSSWEGYGPVAFAVEGKPVTNITVEKNVVSTSISNIVRAGWPEKNFEGGNFLMRDSDVIHMGLGGCGIPFALMEVWADPNGRGQSGGFHFENIRMEDWYSLVQLREPSGKPGSGVRDVMFTDVAGLEQPSLVPSVISGSVQATSFRNVSMAGDSVRAAADLPLTVSGGAEAGAFTTDGPQVTIKVSEGLSKPGQPVHFEAVGETNGLKYLWTFGDGAHATGRKVTHRFPDTQGTLLDGSGRFRVLLATTDAAGRHGWASAPIVIADALRPSLAGAKGEPGVRTTYRESGGGSEASAEQTGVATDVTLSAIAHRASDYAVTFDGDFEAPQDGGYTFLLVANETATLEIDGVRLAASLPPISQVCGLAGMAARAIQSSTPLARGRHHLHVTESHTQGHDDFRLMWRGPGFPLQPISPASLSH